MKPDRIYHIVYIDPTFLSSLKEKFNQYRHPLPLPAAFQSRIVNMTQTTVSVRHDVFPVSPKKSTPALSPQVAELMKKESEYIVGGFAPLPVYITGGKGSTLRVGSISANITSRH